MRRGGRACLRTWACWREMQHASASRWTAGARRATVAGVSCDEDLFCGGAIMPNDWHQRAAEFHEMAAHAHRAAAVHHGKQDHLTGSEYSRQAKEHPTRRIRPRWQLLRNPRKWPRSSRNNCAAACAGAVRSRAAVARRCYCAMCSCTLMKTSCCTPVAGNVECSTSSTACCANSGLESCSASASITRPSTLLSVAWTITG